jgi:hypothetical protein
MSPEKILAPMRSVVELTRMLVEERTRREMVSAATSRPKIVLRAASLGPDAARSQMVDEATPSKKSGATADRRSTVPTAAEPALDIERLTDQIVRKIDERILAHRERMGRAF